MGLQPTMSRTDLLLECQWPFSPDVEIPPDPPGKEARYGSVIHAGIATGLALWLKAGAPAGIQFQGTLQEVCRKALKTHDCNADVEDVEQHVIAALRVLMLWLRGKNQWGINFTARSGDTREEIESSVALSPRMRHPSRGIELREEDHHYVGLKKGELAGTLDLKLSPLVVDHKTGHKDFSTPSDYGQLRSQGLCVTPDAADRRYLAVLHTPREGIPAVYAEEWGADEAEAHRKKLVKAMRRIGDGSMRPGPWCNNCPAESICPTRNNDLLARSASLVEAASTALAPVSPETIVTADYVGRLHLLISQFTKLAEPVKKAIKEWVEAHPDQIVAREDGKVLMFVERGYSNLSQASIIRAYGKVKGARVIKKLLRDGAIETGKRRELWPVNDR